MIVLMHRISDKRNGGVFFKKVAHSTITKNLLDPKHGNINSFPSYLY